MDISQSGILITNSSATHGKPISVPDASAANAMLLSSNVGRVILFTGQTAGSFTNGSMYIVAETE